MAAPAILSYVSHNAWPDSESVSSANLNPGDLTSLITSLRAEQDSARQEIRSLSQSSAPDIDSWIARAKALQADILRSRESARQIVAEAEKGKQLRAEVEDKRKKVGLLEKEVAFNETLTGTLEHIRHANVLLERSQQEAVLGNVERALARLDDAEASILALESVQGTKAGALLKEKTLVLRQGLVETTTECWDAYLLVREEERKFKVRQKPLQADVPDAAVTKLTLDHIVLAVKGLGLMDTLASKLSKDFERAILRPKMMRDEDGLVAKITTHSSELSAYGTSDVVSWEGLLEDLHTILEFLATKLPSSITAPLSETLIPALTALLEEHWLEPAIPLSMADAVRFTPVLQGVEALADQIERYGWQGAGALREWLQEMPRTWLTKRREAVLGNVRNLVFEGSRERKVVERVETRVVSKDDPAIVGAGGGEEGTDEDWDGAWDEPDESEPAPAQKNEGHAEHEDEDASAWDIDDDEEKIGDPSSSQDDEGAWDAWDDEAEEEPQKLPSPIDTKKQPAVKPNGDTAALGEQEMTLRETFTVTSIPDGILSTLQQIVSDAETLSGADFSSSPLAPASQALYTLPTLALAIYRATASTAYGKVDVGNMLIYNDSLHLADLLRSWQESRSAGSSGRLRLDNDLAALETFAKRAYASEMESQRTILRDLLDGAQGFSNSTVQPFKSECEDAVQATVDRVRDVHDLWRSVLSQGALLQSLGSLLSTVTVKMIGEIEDLGDISEADSAQLKALCERVMQIRSLFIQIGTDGEGEGQDMTFVYCPTWLKFQYLAEILESSLADIKWMWKEGELSLEFDADELVEMIEALFAESEYRRNAVRDIRGGGRGR